jgi:hypothetical protein
MNKENAIGSKVREVMGAKLSTVKALAVTLIEMKAIRGALSKPIVVSSLPFISPIALLRLDNRERKAEAGKHFRNYYNSLGEKLPLVVSEGI